MGTRHWLWQAWAVGQGGSCRGTASTFAPQSLGRESRRRRRRRAASPVAAF